MDEVRLQHVNDAESAWKQGLSIIARCLNGRLRQLDSNVSISPPLKVKRGIRLDDCRDRLAPALVHIGPIVRRFCDLTPSPSKIWKLGKAEPLGTSKCYDKDLQMFLEAFVNRIYYPDDALLREELVDLMVEDQKRWQQFFDDLRRYFSTTHARVELDCATMRLYIDGRCWQLDGVRWEIIKALVEARDNGNDFVSGRTLNNLPLCEGRKISREIRNLTRAIGPLGGLIESVDWQGYRLSN